MSQEVLNNPVGEEILFEIGGSGDKNSTQKFDEDLYIELTGNFFIDSYRRLDDWMKSMTTIKMKEKMTFFQLLSVTLNAGVPITKALRTIANEIKNVRLRKITLGLAKRIEKGKKLSAAMEDFPNVFNASQTGMVHAGEASGKLNEIFEKINHETEKNTKLNSRMKGAMIYPIVVMSILGIVMSLMMILVIPRIGTVFTDAGLTLPPITRGLIAFSGFMQSYWMFLLIGLAAAIFGLKVLKKTPLGQWYFDIFLINLPIFGKLFRMMAIAKFARTLSALISSGVSIVKALQIDAEAVGNEVYRKRILIAADDVAKGIPLGENLSGNEKLFPSLIVSMVAIGEQNAELSNVMDKIADYYDNEIEIMTQGISKLMEPLILIILGVSVGLLVMAIMQPIMSLTDLADTL
ncbi:MAG: type II secretion system F family protein [Candidatus Peregrinibacteria bacterium]|nr:type II secretion system F family protein [Candidatus Peregrinibacteria bacterium]MDZ4244288.1 type II secretion system F family protein [Candidatus Gracilibacteria bacterium]